jgi:type IV pilus assembly protein PilM
VLTLFKQKNPHVLGIDISSSSVKLLELSRRHGQDYHVESFSVASLPANTIVDKTIQDRATLMHTIQRLLTDSRTKITQSAIAVPDSSIITKVLQVNAELNDYDIENHIAFEADKYIPYPLEEVNIDFNILGPNAENKELMDVLLVCCRSDTITAFTEVLEESGLTTKIVDVESYAIARACELIRSQLPNQGDKRIIGIFNIGHDITTLTVLNDFKTIFSRETNFGGQQLIEQIQQRYQLTRGQALERIQQHTLPDDYQETILNPFKEALVLHIRRSLQFFFSSSQHSEIHHLVLTGGTSGIAGLAELLTSQLGTDASIADPFQHMSFAPKINITSLRQHTCSLMLCCGLAMRSFD